MSYRHWLIGQALTGYASHVDMDKTWMASQAIALADEVIRQLTRESVPLPTRESNMPTNCED